MDAEGGRSGASLECEHGTQLISFPAETQCRFKSILHATHSLAENNDMFSNTQVLPLVVAQGNEIERHTINLPTILVYIVHRIPESYHIINDLLKLLTHRRTSISTSQRERRFASLQAQGFPYLCLRSRRWRWRLTALGRPPPEGVGDGVTEAHTDALEEVADEPAAIWHRVHAAHDGSDPSGSSPAAATAAAAAAEATSSSSSAESATSAALREGGAESHCCESNKNDGLQHFVWLIWLD